MSSGPPAKDREVCGYLTGGFTRAVCVMPVALSIFPIMLRLAEEGERRSDRRRASVQRQQESAGICWADRHRGLSGPFCGARPIPHPRSLRRARTALLPEPSLPLLS